MVILRILTGNRIHFWSMAESKSKKLPGKDNVKLIA